MRLTAVAVSFVDRGRRWIHRHPAASDIGVPETELSPQLLGQTCADIGQLPIDVFGVSPHVIAERLRDSLLAVPGDDRLEHLGVDKVDERLALGVRRFHGEGVD